MGTISSASSATRRMVEPEIRAKAMPLSRRDHRPPLQRTRKKESTGASSTDCERAQPDEQASLASRWIEVVNLPVFDSNEGLWSTRLLKLCNSTLSTLPDFDDESDSEPVVKCWSRPSSSRGTRTHTIVAELQNCALASSAARVLDGLRFRDKFVEARVIDPP
jgi:hypothetical protein